jgi:hypothetical protein
MDLVGAGYTIRPVSPMALLVWWGQGENQAKHFLSSKQLEMKMLTFSHFALLSLPHTFLPFVSSLFHFLFSFLLCHRFSLPCLQ